MHVGEVVEDGEERLPREHVELAARQRPTRRDAVEPRLEQGDDADVVVLFEDSEGSDATTGAQREASAANDKHLPPHVTLPEDNAVGDTDLQREPRHDRADERSLQLLEQRNAEDVFSVERDRDLILEVRRKLGEDPALPVELILADSPLVLDRLPQLVDERHVQSAAVVFDKRVEGIEALHEPFPP